MMKITKIFYMFAFCFIALNCYADSLNMSVDKTSVSQGDILYLSIEYDGESQNTPDMSSLQSDFHIVSTSSSQNINIINGNVSRAKKWTYGLQPLKSGKIVIAPIKLDNLISNSVEVEIKELGDVAYIPDMPNKSNQNTDINAPWIERTTDVSSPYVQQQTIFWVNIYDNVGLADGSLNLTEESKKDWIIIPLLSEPAIRQEVINQSQFRVLSFAYAAFPQKSGILAQPQFIFDGYYVKDAQFGMPFSHDFDVFGFNFPNVFGQRVPIKMQTKAESINVKPIPNGFSGRDWLPIKDFKIESSWNARNGFKVGEAITRTIKITATGMNEAMLPKISFGEADGFKQYPEKPSTSEQVIQGQIVTTSEMNNVYIPTRSGELTIPKISIQWFNVEKNQFEETSIQEETVLVLPNANMTENNSFNEIKSDTNIDNNEIETKKETKTAETSFSDLFSPYKDLLTVVIGVLFTLFVLALFVVLKKKNNYYRNMVIRAIKRHDYKAAKDALLIWAENKYGVSIKNFNDISHLVGDDSFSFQLSALNKILYASSGDFFETDKFISTFKKIDKQKKKKEKYIDVLPNLYD